MIRENINTLDFKLKNYFDNVVIKEKSEKSKFLFELNLNKNNRNLIIDIDKEFLNQNIYDINWKYLSNPNDKTSFVERKPSGVNNLVHDIIEMKKEELEKIQRRKNN